MSTLKPINFYVIVRFLFLPKTDVETFRVSLLNYSEHGTVVYNVVYCCDVDGDAATFKSEAEDVKEKKPSFHAGVR
jgi:hypothetical protein